LLSIAINIDSSFDEVMPENRRVRQLRYGVNSSSCLFSVLEMMFNGTNETGRTNHSVNCRRISYL